jgi:hypothetical protein
LFRPEALAALLLMITMALIMVSYRFQFSRILDASLYPRDGRRPFAELEENRYPGAGVLMCFSEFGTLERAAAAWLIGFPNLVVLNAHNFVDRKLVPTHSVTDCFFRIKGADYYFAADSLRIGASVESKSLHITDDWALLRLTQPVARDVTPQPIPDASFVATGAEMSVVTGAAACKKPMIASRSCGVSTRYDSEGITGARRPVGPTPSMMTSMTNYGDPESQKCDKYATVMLGQRIAGSWRGRLASFTSWYPARRPKTD